MMDTIDFKSRAVNFTLLVLRVGIGLLMLGHGIPKLEMLIIGDIQFPSVMGMSPTISLLLAVFAEVVCSILLLIGLLTRFATIPLIVTMLTAVLVIHGNDPFVKQELGILYLIVYLTLFMLGSGKFSFDGLFNSYKLVS
ncbi:DoxX family protein [Altibacter lentus]|uniref:DoxX family protein n=1 Tax=Altibacter lentus TaxID=1223410 RepID=UPI000557D5DD|nr:DoxX family membrane protein [Altibacter lentus]